MITFFIKGLIIGIAIAAPIGPIAILCIYRSLHNGFKIGMMTGLGAAFADGTYGIVAGFGLTAISSLLVAEQFWIRILGGLFLIYLGIKLLFTPPKKPQHIKGKSDRSSLHAFLTCYALTLMSPMTILSFIAIFAGLGIGVGTDYTQALLFVFGIISGSALWSLFLCGITSLFHHRITPNKMRIINWISGIILLGFGVFALKVF